MSRLTNLYTKRNTTYAPYEIGFSPSLFSVSGQSAVWTTRTVDLSGYSGATCYLVFSHTVASTGTAFYADLQLDTISVNGVTYNFDTSTESFQTSVTCTTFYSSVSWTVLGTSTASDKWNRDAGGTPSSSTGLASADSGSYYVYTESSSPVVNNDTFWLRSPQITLLPNQTLSFAEARYGGTIGTLNFYLDVIS